MDTASPPLSSTISITSVSSRPATPEVVPDALAPVLDQSSSHAADQDVSINSMWYRQSPHSTDSEWGLTVPAQASPLDIPAAQEALSAASDTPSAANEAFPVIDENLPAASEATILRDVRRIILVQEALQESRVKQLHWDAVIEKVESEKEQVAQTLKDSRLVLEDTQGRLIAAENAFQHVQQNFDEVARRLDESRQGLQSHASLIERLENYLDQSGDQIGALIGASVNSQDRSFVDSILRGDSL